MNYEYSCPHCQCVLNPNVRVVLVGHFEGRRGLVLLSSKLGDYQLICDRGLRIICGCVAVVCKSVHSSQGILANACAEPANER